MTDLNAILVQAQQAVRAADTLRALEECRVFWFGKKGKLTDCLRQVALLPAEERPAAGKKVNALREQVILLFGQQQEKLETEAINKKLSAEALDVTLPGRGQNMGSLHPVTWTCCQVEAIFSRMGFWLASGPEIEDDYHNFEALNVPPLHPARAMQDTFYFPGHTLLRTHMSPVQIRVMHEVPPPFRMIAMGRVYRRDFDLTHTPMFHQVEGLIVDDGLGFAGLKDMLVTFLRNFFAADIPIRFRASYFPFTEPSAEVDIGCQGCGGGGCRICSHTGWLEVLGCGMVHPEVFRMAGVDSERYTGWAFGAGLDRLSMLRHGIGDLRSLFENDLRFLEQFGGTPT